jgi:signal peptidase I
MIVLIVLIVAGAAVGITPLVTHSSTTPSTSSNTSSSQATDFRVTGGNMLPAIPVGATVSVSYPQGFNPRRGDVIVFPSQHAINCGSPEVKYDLSRVIGLPGETISLSSGHVYIDGRQLDETWLSSAEQGITDPGPPGNSFSLHRAYRVPADTYYVMGDNRTFSCDSRYWGPVPLLATVGFAK